MSHCCLNLASLDLLSAFCGGVVITPTIVVSFLCAACVMIVAISHSVLFSRLVVRNMMSVLLSRVSSLGGVVVWLAGLMLISILWFACELFISWGFVVMIAVGVVVGFVFVSCVIVWLPCSLMPMMRVLGWVGCWVVSACLRVPCHLGCRALLVCFLPAISIPLPNLCG